MADQTQAPAPSKTIEISGKNTKLDQLLGKQTTETQTETQSDPQQDDSTTQVDNQAKPGDNATVNKDDAQATGGGADKTKTRVIEEDPSSQAQQQQEVNEPEEVELEELYLEVDGKDRSVAELLSERDTLAKRVAEIDGDPFLKDLIAFYKETGDLHPYLEARAIDYDKKDDLEILRIEFDKRYADFDPKVKEKMWRRELSQKYKQNPEATQEELESDDYLIAQEMMKRDADKARKAFKDEQKKFQLPEKKKEQVQEQQKYDPAAFKQSLVKEKEVDAFLKSKTLRLGVKDASGKDIGIEVPNADQVVEMMTNDTLFFKQFIDPTNKSIDRAKQAMVYQFALDPNGFIQDLVSLGKNIGLEERLKEVKNTDGRLNKQTTESQVKATNWKEGFLKAAIQQNPKR